MRSSILHRLPSVSVSAFVLLLVAALVVVSCRRAGEVSSGVQLVAAQEPLGPGTTFELRFDQPVVVPAELGKVAKSSPLRIRPALRGDFVWLSERSGVFTPRERLKLDTAYHFTLASGLRNASGQPIAAELDRTLRTPGLTVRLLAPDNLPGSQSNASSQPRLALEFNSAVQAASVAEHLRFRRPGGFERRAVVTQANDELLRQAFHWWFRSPAPTWEETSLGAEPILPGGPPPVPLLPLPASPPANAPWANVIFVTAASPLDVGEGWELALARGLPAAQSGLRLAEDFVLPIGTVRPFAVERVEANNALNLGRRIEIGFSKRLAESVTADTLTNWVNVLPEPEDFSIQLDGSVVHLAGDFDLERPVRVVVKAGLPGDESFELPMSVTNEVRFTPVPPRLYFAGFNTEQYASGRREFPLLAVNVTQAVVRAKLIEPDAVVHALGGYSATFRRSWREPGVHEEPYREVPYTLMPGRTVFDQSLAITGAVDEPKLVPLRWDELLGTGRRGVVFLDARQSTAGYDFGPGQGVQALVQLTDLGLVTKASRDEVVALAFHLSNGQPAGGALVKLLTAENEVLTQARADDKGIVRLPQTLRTNHNARLDWRYQSLPPETASPVGDWLVAQTDDDLRAAALNDLAIPASFGERPWLWSAVRERWRLLAFTDRPAYRPGETVQVKVIAREWRDNDWHVPAGQVVKLELADAHGRQVLATNLALGDLASLDRAISLPAAPLGTYLLTASGGDGTTTASFTVQEFKPNAFEVTVTGRPEYGPAEPPEFRVAARYYHGQALSRAKVMWAVQGTDRVEVPESFEDFRFGTQVWQAGLGYQAGSFSDSGSTNFVTGMVLQPEVPINPEAPHPRHCSLLVSITDVNQQSVSREVEFVRHSSDFYLGVGLPAEVSRAGEPFPIRLAAMGTNGQPWRAGVPVKLTFKRVKWNSVRVEMAGGVIGYRNEPEILPAAEVEAATEEIVMTGDRWAAAGDARWSFTPAEPGAYVVRARAVDAGGRPVFSAAEFHVYGKDTVGWAYRNETQLSLVPDQAAYTAGQTARILVKTPIAGLALVSIEREKVLRSWVTNLADGAPVIEVPLVESDAPNVQVSVVQVRGAEQSPHDVKVPEFRAGGAQLVVSRTDRKLNVNATLSAPEYRPADEVRLEGLVRDQAGAPVEGAEVTAFAVDEGVLSLTGYTPPDPAAWFSAARAVEVQTGITLPNLFPEDPTEHHFQNKGFLVGDGAGGLRVRNDFRALAFWNATLRTDAAGRVAATFRSPDSLTRYRVVMVAHTARSQFGRAESAFAVNKPLMVEPALPRCANVGDRLLARAVVFNRLAVPGEVEVTVKLDDKARPGGEGDTNLTRRLLVPANAAMPLDVPLEFLEAGEAVWTWRARFVGGEAGKSEGSFTDAVESRLPVGFPAPLLREVHLARVVAGATNLLSRVNPQLLAGKGRVVVRVANTRLAELRQAAGQLIRYPYGCTEQLTSTLLPLLALRTQPTALEGVVTNVAALDGMIRYGLDRILARQTYGGGFAYWPGGEPEFWISAYAGVAVALARGQGFAISDRSFNELMDYLRGQFVAGQMAPNARLVPLVDAAWEAEARCLALYALALGGRSESAYHEHERGRLTDLPIAGRAWLALAIAEAKGPLTLAEEILTSPVTPAAASAGRYGSEASDLGVTLLAWTRVRPDAPAVDRLVSELLGARGEGHWFSTQGNAWAILALTSYAKAVEEGFEPATGSLDWAGRTEFSLSATPQTREFAFALDAAKGGQPLTVIWPGARPLFTELLIEARPPVWQQPRQERGLAISRRYARLDETNGLHGVEGWRVGDRVLVSLEIRNDAVAHHLAVDDPLPAVLEAVNPAFASQAAGADQLVQDWVSQHREMRNDRVLFFNRELEPGRHAIRYLARVRAAGTATAAAAKVEEMYRPDRFGLTETTTLTAAPAE